MRRLGWLCGVLLAACGDTPNASDTRDAVADADTVEETSEDTTDASPDALEETADADTVEETSPDVDTVEETSDADTVETSEVDAVEDADTGEADVEVTPELPLAGFGEISGACGVIDDELYDTAPSLFVNALDFGDDPYGIEDFDRLTAFGQEIILDGNAGGSSLYSEVFAMEVLARCELATLIATENEIRYDVDGKITDLLVALDGERVGVSVVRAVGFPKDAPYTVEQARTILERKLADILVSSANVSAEHRWVKQVLSVIAYAEGHVTSIEAAWEAIPAETRADTIVIVTVTHGDDAFLY